MTWMNLAFLHWPVPVEMLRPLVPLPLEIDTFGGDAWVAVVPFEMRDVRIRGLPGIPTATNFPELNVRTYVHLRGHRGVWFFSLDAASWLAVLGASAATSLPYHHAAMSTRVGGDGAVAYESARTGTDASLARFRATYRPDSRVFRAAEGSFEHWCTDLKCLYSAVSMSELLRLDIEHDAWPLQRATVEIATNTMAAASDIQLPATPPHALFAKHLDVVAHWPQSI